MSDTAVMESDFIKQVISQIRAQDLYGVFAKKTDEDLLKPFIVNKEERKKIPIIGDPKPAVIDRLKTFYSAIGLLIEKRTGIMCSSVMDMSHEGFGRVVLLAGRLVAVNKQLRDVHRFGFLDMEKFNEEGEKLVSQGVEMIGKYREVAEY